MKRIILFLAIAVSLASCSTESVQEVEALATIEVTATTSTHTEGEILALVNNHRAGLGLSALELDNTVYQYATEHNQYMVNQGTTSHDNFTARAKSLTSKTNAVGVAENVAVGSQLNANIAVNGWLGSVPHKESIEGDFTHTGISVLTNDEGLTYFTQIFIKK